MSNPLLLDDSFDDGFGEDPLNEVSDQASNQASIQDRATLEQLKAANIDDLTPRQALSLLYELKNGLSSD